MLYQTRTAFFSSSGPSYGVWAPTLTTADEAVWYAVPLETPDAPVVPEDLPLLIMAPILTAARGRS